MRGGPIYRPLEKSNGRTADRTPGTSLQFSKHVGPYVKDLNAIIQNFQTVNEDLNVIMGMLRVEKKFGFNNNSEEYGGLNCKIL